MVDAYRLVRPLLFRLDPERAHTLGMRLLRFTRRFRVDDPSLRVTTAIGELANPIGMPAGYDKSGRHLSSLSRIGFGYIVAGTFTLEARPGHPKPRVVRNVAEMTLVNALGFPNPGIDSFVHMLSRERLQVPVLASISGSSVGEILECYSRAQPHVAGIELNLSSPNSPGLRDLRELSAFRELASRMRPLAIRPTYLKIPPYLDPEQFSGLMRLVRLWEDEGFPGITASNAIPIEDTRVAVGRGGYSGPPLLEHTKKAVSTVRRSVAASFEINAVGGVGSVADVCELLGLGATTVQMFTALVYNGPSLMRRILSDPSLGESTVLRRRQEK